MTETQSKSKLPAALVGLVLVAAAVYSVAFVEWRVEVPPEEPPVRPLKTIVVSSTYSAPGRKYPGRVKANREVELAFQVAGPLIERPIRSSDKVVAGQLLARIDPRDFEQELSAARGGLAKAQSDIDKLKRLFESGNAGRQEVVDAQARYDISKAREEIAAKALDDTNLRAPFAGVIARIYVENFQNVRAKEHILSLQDVSHVDIEVNVPEEVVVIVRSDEVRPRFVVTFDYLPDDEFVATWKEHSTEADPITQTYLVTLTMPAPEDVRILPGMTATITPDRTGLEVAEGSGFEVSVDAVPLDGLGNYFVWKIKEDADGTWTVHRTDVKVGEMKEDKFQVVEGLDRGDRIAGAGVHVLKEGQRVRALDPTTGDPRP